MLDRANSAKLTPMRGLVIFGPLTLLPLWLLAFLTLTFAERGMLKQSERHLRGTSAAVAVFVAQHFSGLANLVDAYATRPAFLEAIGNGDLDRAQTSTIMLHLSQLQKTRSGIAAACVADLQGKIIAVVPETRSIMGRDFSHRDWYRGVTHGRGPYVSEVFISAATGGQRVVSVAALMRDESRGGVPVAILVVAYTTQTIQDFTEEFARAQSVRLSITDQRGVLAADPTQPRPDSLARVDRPGVADALRGETGVVRSIEDDAAAVLAFTPVAGLGWTVTSSEALHQTLAPIRSLRRAVFIITGLLTAILTLGLVAFELVVRRGRQADFLARREAGRVQGMLQGAHDAFVSINTAGHITAWNAQAERTFGVRQSDAIGLSLSETIIPPDQRRAHLKGLTHLAATGEGLVLNQRLEMTALKADGSTFPVELAVWIGVAGEQPEFSAFIRDITERKQTEAKLQALHEELRVSARTDPLTGLGNRLRMDEDLAGWQARYTRYGHAYAVALLDIDYFKLYNDCCGHLAGDQALRQVAGAIAQAARSGDTVYRFGGEEIVCIFPDQTLQTAVIAAERLRAAVMALRIAHPDPSTSGVLTISVGVASQCIEPCSTETLLEAADRALYLAKQQGRNRVCSTAPPASQVTNAR